MNDAGLTQSGPYTNFGVVPRETALGMSGLEFLEAIRDRTLPAPPFAGLIDIWLAEVEAGRVVFEGRPSARFYNPLGTVHGGWVSSLLDSAMGCAVHSRLKAGQGYTTVDLKVSLVRAVTKATGALRCEGVSVHAGGRIATAEGRVWDAAGKLIAHGSETCLVVDGAAGTRNTPA